MTDTSKKLVLGSIGVAGVVSLVAILDLVLGIPFSGQMVMDILFLIAAGLVIYLGIETLKELG